MITSGTVYNHTSFAGEQLDPAGLVAAEFIDCEFKSCNFQRVTLQDCRFVDCKFTASDLSLIEVPGSVFSAVRFEDSKIIGVNWARANWTLPALRERVSFYRSVLNHSTFLGLTLPGLKVIDCEVHGADFREANLSQADFSMSDLQESLFGKTVLTEADFSRARNYLIHPGQNTLLRARFSLPEALSLLFSLEIHLEDRDLGTELR